MKRKRIVHLIVGLGNGGAETMLYNLLRFGNREKYDYRVISLLGEGFYGERIRSLGVPVISACILKNPVVAVWRCFREISKADVLATWMYHANLLGFFVAKLTRCRRIVWNVRHSNLNPELNNRLTMVICRVCAPLSRFVSKIAYNGNSARRAHEFVGYAEEKAVVLDNGCNVSVYKKYQDGENRLSCEFVRRNFDAPVLLSVARWSAQKDVPNFLKALAVLKARGIPAVAVFCGNGLDEKSEPFADAVKAFGLELGKDVAGLGPRNDVPRLMSACDLFVLHSAGEAFPNVLIQAMACECACVATDAGDARRILNDDENVVPTRDSEALAKRIAEMLSAPEALRAAGKRNRERVLELFSVEKIIRGYEALWEID